MTDRTKSSAAPRNEFWEKPVTWLVLALLSATPFLFVTVVPFNDLPNHVGRHYVFLNVGHDPFLQRFYSLHWSLIGNLGIDLIVRAIGPWLGADLATHVAVSLIPPLTIAGIYALSRSLNGRVSPSALLATPLVLNWPLITGFANFCLSAAIALLVLALWIRLRSLNVIARFVLFTPLALLTWLAHTAGWGLLGLGVLAFECSRAWNPNFQWKPLLLAPFQTAPFATVFVLILFWRHNSGNGAASAYGPDLLKAKAVAIMSLMREHFVVWDMISTAILLALFVLMYHASGRRYVRAGLFIALAYLVAFLLCPQELFKSGFADRRLLVYAVIMAALAIGAPSDAANSAAARHWLRLTVSAVLALFVARVAVATVVWSRASRAHEQHLALLQAVPPHSRIFGLVVEQCGQSWNRVGRPDHIQQYALVRRDSMINGMYQNPGLNQVTVLFARNAEFDPNLYAVVHDERCPVGYISETFQSAVRKFPREMFDYVWLIGEEPLPGFDTSGLRLVAATGNDRMYRIVR